MGRLRLSPDRYVWLCRLALVSLIGIVVTGGAVRLTGSGLGCSDWPTCESDRLVAPLEFHPMVEFVNRVITGLVSLLVIAAVLGALARVPRRRDLVWLALGLVGGVLAQILLGAALVLAHLDPRFTIGHFLLSALLVGNAVVLTHRAGRTDLDPSSAPARTSRMRSSTAVRRSTGLLVPVGAALVVTGTIVTGTGPHGGDKRADRLGFDISDVTRVHSLTAWVFVGLVVVTGVLLARREGSGPRFVAVRRLLTIAVLQGSLGYAQYFAGVPPLLVGFHLLGATLVWAATVEVGLLVFERGPAPGLPGRDTDPKGEVVVPGVATGAPHPGTLAGRSRASVPVVPAREGSAVGIEVD